MIRVALTGGIASGKSSVAELFAAHGVPILDADLAARTVVAPGSPGLQGVVERFGSELLQQDGTLDRKRLRAIIFADPVERQALEQLLHPLIAENLLQQARAITAPYLIFMIPLLTQRQGPYPIDRVLVVDLPRSLQIERVMARDQINRQQAEAILAAQPDRDHRLALADDTIINIDRTTLPGQVERLHQQYLQLARRQ